MVVTPIVSTTTTAMFTRHVTKVSDFSKFYHSGLNIRYRFNLSNSNSLRDRSGYTNDRFGSEPSSSGRASPFYGNGNGYGASQRTAESLESQNDEQIEGLGLKVKALKEVRNISMTFATQNSRPALSIAHSRDRE